MRLLDFKLHVTRKLVRQLKLLMKLQEKKSKLIKLIKRCISLRIAKRKLRWKLVDLQKRRGNLSRKKTLKRLSLSKLIQSLLKILLQLRKKSMITKTMKNLNLKVRRNVIIPKSLLFIMIRSNKTRSMLKKDRRKF
jgi:hypothetical protein